MDFENFDEQRQKLIEFYEKLFESYGYDISYPVELMDDYSMGLFKLTGFFEQILHQEMKYKADSMIDRPRLYDQLIEADFHNSGAKWTPRQLQKEAEKYLPSLKSEFVCEGKKLVKSYDKDGLIMTIEDVE